MKLVSQEHTDKWFFKRWSSTHWLHGY